MARLTNEEIWNMSPAEADRYSDLHPAEAWRFAKAHSKSAAKQTKKAIKHGLKSGILQPEPDTIEVY